MSLLKNQLSAMSACAPHKPLFQLPDDTAAARPTTRWSMTLGSIGGGAGLVCLRGALQHGYIHCTSKLWASAPRARLHWCTSIANARPVTPLCNRPAPGHLLGSMLVPWGWIIQNLTNSHACLSVHTYFYNWQMITLAAMAQQRSVLSCLVLSLNATTLCPVDWSTPAGCPVQTHHGFGSQLTCN